MRKTVKSKGLVASDKSNGRLPRRSPAEIKAMVDRIVGIVKKFGKKNGLRAEQIREHLGVDARELPRPLRVATDTGRLQWDGHKRATTYYAV
jgi:hypothetical protein